MELSHGLQRVPSVAVGGWVQGARHEAVIGSPGCVTISMSGIEGTGGIQPGSPQVHPSTRGRMSAAQEAELTLSTRSGLPTMTLIAAIPVAAVGRF